MNCREFLIEFEERGMLSEPATLHLTVCTDCKKTSEQQAQIWRAIDNFVKINAPNDFDFRVKARIANARPTDFQARFLPVLRYVLPIMVVAVLTGLIAFNTSYFSRGNSGEVTFAEKANPAVIENKTQATNDLPQTSFAPQTKDVGTVTQVPQEDIRPSLNNRIPRNEIAEFPPKQRQKNTKSSDDEFIGWRDSAITTKKPLAPKGIQLDTNSRVEIPKSPDETDILKFNYIETALANGKRTVKSVKENSVAARSGIKVGDVIEKVEGDSIFVLRGTERIEIKLQKVINQP